MLGKTSRTPRACARLSVVRGLLCRGCPVHGPRTCTTTDHPEHPSQVPSRVPGSARLEFPSWTSEELTQHKDQLLLPATHECCFPPHRRRDQLRPEQTRDTVLHACVWSPHLKWLPDASRNLLKPHSPADYPMSYCFCHFSKLPLFCLRPSLPVLMPCLCSVLETAGLQLHLVSPLLPPVLIEMSLLKGKSFYRDFGSFPCRPSFTDSHIY